LRKQLQDAGIDIDEGTLYPLVRRLAEQGLLDSEWQQAEGRERRYYQLSAQGQQLLQNTSRPDPQACLYMEQWVSGTSAKYDASELRLDISIPQAFLLRQSRTAVPPGMLTRGENAGFVNYNLNHYVAQNQTSEFLGLNSGINLQGWQVRHSSFLSQSNSATAGSTQQYVAGETFVRRPLIDWKSSLAMGEITSQSPIVGSVPLRGFRMASEEGLMSEDERSYRPVVRGVARTNARPDDERPGGQHPGVRLDVLEGAHRRRREDHRGAVLEADPALRQGAQLQRPARHHAAADPALLRALQGSREGQVGEGAALGRRRRSPQTDPRRHRAGEEEVTA
jgi:hypothetical protein